MIQCWRINEQLASRTPFLRPMTTKPPASRYCASPRRRTEKTTQTPEIPRAYPVPYLCNLTPSITVSAAKLDPGVLETNCWCVALAFSTISRDR